MSKMNSISMMIQEVEALKEQLGHVDPDSVALNEITKLLLNMTNDLEQITTILEGTGRIIKPN